MVRRWYQTLDIDGVVFEDPNRAKSKYWNEGKWHNFIRPLLQDEKRTFIEIGCNAGLYLKMAKDAGYHNIIGVEGNGQIFQQAEQYRESVSGDWRLIPQRVGKNFQLDSLPVADVVLISNMHYYLPVGVFAKLVDDLRNRCLYTVVVSARAKRRQGNALWDYSSVSGYFKDWKELAQIAYKEPNGDPCPRVEMFSVLYEGNLIPLGVDEYYDAWFEASKKPGHKSHELAPTMQDFFERVLLDVDFDYRITPFYQYWRKRLPKKSEKWTHDWLDYKAELARDIRDNGMTEPIYLDHRMKLLDGIHRLAIAKVLGHRHILVRVL